MWKLVSSLTREMGQAYPELVRAEALITETLKLEETRFRRTLERGLAILEEKSGALKKGDMFDGDTAFTLYDTYGFPLDLTQDALRNRGIGVDIASFTDAMERQRAKARASWSGSGEAVQAAVWFAAFTVTNGVRWTIQWLKASFNRVASSASRPVVTWMPARRRIPNPRPAWAGLGSVAAATTRRMPAALMASVQGGVRPCVQHGSSVT
jgi:hypothetical protein